MSLHMEQKVFGFQFSSFLMVLFIIVGFLCATLAVILWDSGQQAFLSHGGKSAIISIFISIISVVLTPILGDKSLPMVFNILALVFFILAFKKYSIVKALHKAIK